MDEINLIKQCQQGDHEAFNMLFQLNAAKALRSAYLISGKKDLAEEIVQEAYIQCFNDIKKLRDPEKFRFWFYRIVVRYSWKVISREKNRIQCDELNENECPVICDDMFNRVEAEQIREAVHKALNKLSITLRTVVILYYYDGLSTKEIAKVLNCMQGTVKSRLHNARKTLEKELKHSDCFVEENDRKEFGANV